jgi:uncharacterized membrane protein
MKNTSPTPATRTSPQKQGASTATLLFGIWLFIAAFVLATTPEGMRNSLVIGILLMVCSALRLRKESSFLWSCANVVFGFWMLLGPQPLVFGSNPFRWSDFALGWATVTLSILGATGRDIVMRRDTAVVERTSLAEYHKAA